MERRALDADGVVAAPLVVVRRRGVAGETIPATSSTCSGRAPQFVESWNFLPCFQVWWFMVISFSFFFDFFIC
jgi:hypothetical protein